MKLIIISPPDTLPDEPCVVAGILRQTSATIHLRKPGWTDDQLIAYLVRVPAIYHRRIMVHGHWQRLSQFGLMGIHFTETERRRNMRDLRLLRQDRPGCRLSSAFHRITDIPDADGLFDYIFLSPVFDSISKQGYRAAFDHAELKRFLAGSGQTVIALGGIDAQKVAVAAALGFAGVAVLGAVWNAPCPEKAAGHLSSICCAI